LATNVAGSLDVSCALRHDERKKNETLGVPFSRFDAPQLFSNLLYEPFSNSSRRYVVGA
jgi:hypothetical protein